MVSRDSNPVCLVGLIFKVLPPLDASILMGLFSSLTFFHSLSKLFRTKSSSTVWLSVTAYLFFNVMF